MHFMEYGGIVYVQGSVTYQLPSAGLTWSSVFRQLEANKNRLGIIDYSVSQTTLDQVRHFLRLVVLVYHNNLTLFSCAGFY